MPAPWLEERAPRVRVTAAVWLESARAAPAPESALESALPWPAAERVAPASAACEAPRVKASATA